MLTSLHIFFKPVYILAQYFSFEKKQSNLFQFLKPVKHILVWEPVRHILDWDQSNIFQFGTQSDIFWNQSNMFCFGISQSYLSFGTSQKYFTLGNQSLVSCFEYLCVKFQLKKNLQKYFWRQCYQFINHIEPCYLNTIVYGYPLTFEDLDIYLCQLLIICMEYKAC